VTYATIDGCRHNSRPTIDRFWRGYDRTEITQFSTQSVCSTDAHRDVACHQSSHPTEFARSNAVARLLISGGGMCTTWRVGNTNRMLTNKHCADSIQGGVVERDVGGHGRPAPDALPLLPGGLGAVQLDIDGS
jgi:hypothetical protein